MSNTRQQSESNDSNAPIRVDEETWLKMRSRTFIALFGFVVMAVAAGVGYGVGVKRDVASIATQVFDMVNRQASLEVKFDKDHEMIQEQRTSLKVIESKIDYLTGGRRGPVPTAGLLNQQ